MTCKKQQVACGGTRRGGCQGPRQGDSRGKETAEKAGWPPSLSSQDSETRVPGQRDGTSAAERPSESLWPHMTDLTNVFREKENPKASVSSTFLLSQKVMSVTPHPGAESRVRRQRSWRKRVANPAEVGRRTGECHMK